MVDVALRYHSPEQIHFAGIDLFEARDSGHDAGLTLKHAYRLLRSRRIRTHLMPGDPHSALSRIANSLQGYQLVLIGADQERSSLARAWFYLPRAVAADCHILMEEGEGQERSLRRISRLELDKLADARGRRAA
jgi:hypothetical protein